MKHAAPILVFLLLAAPGVRLLWLASRSRQAPELWCGLYFLGASLGISLRVAGASSQQLEPEFALIANTLGHVFLASGTLAMVVFTRRVFHPTHPGARIFAGLTIVTIIATTCHTLFGGYVEMEHSYSVIAANTARVVPTGWAFFESFRYWRAMKKRTALDLADPIVTNRFLLWTLWTGGVTFLPLIALSTRVLALAVIGDDLLDANRVQDLVPKVMGMIRLAFLVIVPISVTALSLSFFPPNAYLERLRARAIRSEPASTP